MDKDTSVLQLKGVGEKTGKLFARLDIRTVGELLSHYPRAYELYEEPVKIKDAAPGSVCAVQGVMQGVAAEKRIRKLHLLSVTLADDTGVMQLTFFHMPFLKKVLKPGGVYLFRGLVQGGGEAKRMEQPKLFSLEEYQRQTNRLLPRYALTKGLTNHAVQRGVKQALSQYRWEEEFYPAWMLEQYSLWPERQSVEAIHFPRDREELFQARRRLAFDEFFSFLYLLQKNKKAGEGLKNRFVMLETADTARFLEKLPFPLTGAQRRVWQEIKQDMSGPVCMNRLIQGDVGSGKTILAILALLMTAANGFQGALMAPTEVLAAQHFETVTDYQKKYDLCFKPVLLVGSMSARQKWEACQRIASGEANLIIGTHALIQQKVEYRALGLVVTDEQHRFGVRQREELAKKGDSPHILVMSATPIPRTLAILLYGDLHLSVVDELPQGRLPIKNCVVDTSYRPSAYRFLAAQTAKGRQAYVICPQVEAGELDELENVVDYTEKLRGALPPGVQVSYLHGKMRPGDKAAVMEAFAAHAIDILVSTTVIEVGINVPNATVMMVENAERFGLSQLHQLRGRVGRGPCQSYCIFVSASQEKEAMERLQILNRSNDGFFIASEDLKLRGPGELFGLRQSGDFAFRLADIYTDAAVLQEAARAVEELTRRDASLSEECHAALKRRLEERSGNSVDFRTI